MNVEIIFDETSRLYENNIDYLKLLLYQQGGYIKDTYKAKGFIYLSNIYEILDMKWNPYNTNDCWILERDGFLDITIKTITKDSPSKFIISISNTNEKSEL